MASNRVSQENIETNDEARLVISEETQYHTLNILPTLYCMLLVLVSI